MASAAEHVSPALDQTALFQQLDSYAWDADEEFKNGLSVILGSAASPEQAFELTLRARCFFFARKTGTPVDFDGYKAWKALNTAISSSDVSGLAPDAAASASSNEPEPGPKLSYQEIVDLIQNGKPVPGIKEIPKTILEGQGTTATKSVRRKPWEKDTPTAETAAPVEATAEAV